MYGYRMLHAVGVGYMELFATHIEAYKEAHIQGACVSQRMLWTLDHRPD